MPGRVVPLTAGGPQLDSQQMPNHSPCGLSVSSEHLSHAVGFSEEGNGSC